MTAGPPATGSPPVGGHEVEKVIAFDMVKRGLPLAPLVVVLAGVVRGWPGVASAALAVAVVLVNLVLAAAILTWAARISLSMIMAGALGGFALRMGLVTLIVVLVKDRSWIDLPALAVSILVTHLGLLFWETRFVSASLAFPALEPSSPREASS